MDHTETREYRGYPQATIHRTVEWVDTDASGHQHNSAVLRWVEAAEAELLRNLQLTDYFPVAPRVQQVVNYKAKLWFGQRVTATVRIHALGRTSLTMAFEVRSDAGGTPGRDATDRHTLDDDSSDSGAVAAFGTVTTAHVPAGATAAQPWPEHFVQVLRGP